MLATYPCDKRKSRAKRMEIMVKALGDAVEAIRDAYVNEPILYQEEPTAPDVLQPDLDWWLSDIRQLQDDWRSLA